MAFVQFILEGYDGICSISTIDSRAGLIRIDMMPGFEQTVLKVLEYLNSEVAT